ncbi:hypothetical protein [Desulfallas thermosapovorans]|uniref:Uncharacterized protein n=1 Tax=Desulfallas thermosapovorans DSM 6562 TaxID=1121431 RepID=A0A5S4ZSV7_9FIRM|nr:hypothetical protein [Desulfallas thermosapovorans]TYO95871.1 hypothetical protein LX24_01260 [Desulfallas thermosapovorans DSM 6562]
MLSDFLHCLETEVIKRDPRITGLEMVYPASGQKRLQLIVSVLHLERRELRIPVTVSLEDINEGNLPPVIGVILQTVDLSTWGLWGCKHVRESVKVTA